MPLVSEWVLSHSYSPEDFAIELSRKYPSIKLIIITKGENGSLAFDSRRGEFHYCDAVPTSVVSTVGAGDSFGAAFLTKYLAGSNINESLSYASEISSFVCSKKEAVPDMSRFI